MQVCKDVKKKKGIQERIPAFSYKKKILAK